MAELVKRHKWIDTWSSVPKQRKCEIVTYYKGDMSLTPEHLTAVLIYTRGEPAETSCQLCAYFPTKVLECGT